MRYHGILAPCASCRDRVVPAGGADFTVAGHEPATESAPAIKLSEREAELAALTDARVRHRIDELGIRLARNADYAALAGTSERSQASSE